jgi:hypothetical protein
MQQEECKIYIYVCLKIYVHKDVTNQALKTWYFTSQIWYIVLVVMTEVLQITVFILNKQTFLSLSHYIINQEYYHHPVVV